jgi:hypothetical protein
MAFKEPKKDREKLKLGRLGESFMNARKRGLRRTATAKEGMKAIKEGRAMATGLNFWESTRGGAAGIDVVRNYRQTQASKRAAKAERASKVNARVQAARARKRTLKSTWLFNKEGK